MSVRDFILPRLVPALLVAGAAGLIALSWNPLSATTTDKPEAPINATAVANTAQGANPDPQTQLFVTWTTPTIEGDASLVAYTLAHRVKDNELPWVYLQSGLSDTATSALITGLATATTYELSLQAVTSDDNGPTVNFQGITDNVNSPPRFPGAGATRSVVENAPAGTSVGAPVTAADFNLDPLTYSISSNDYFDIGAATGRITVKDGAGLDKEAADSHTVTVSVSDGLSDNGEITDTAVDATIAVAINVLDDTELPGLPVAPQLESLSEPASVPTAEPTPAPTPVLKSLAVDATATQPTSSPGVNLLSTDNHRQQFATPTPSLLSNLKELEPLPIGPPPYSFPRLTPPPAVEPAPIQRFMKSEPRPIGPPPQVVPQLAPPPAVEPAPAKAEAASLADAPTTAPPPPARYGAGNWLGNYWGLLLLLLLLLALGLKLAWDYVGSRRPRIFRF